MTFIECTLYTKKKKHATLFPSIQTLFGLHQINNTLPILTLPDNSNNKLSPIIIDP